MSMLQLLSTGGEDGFDLRRSAKTRIGRSKAGSYISVLAMFSGVCPSLF